MSASAGYRILVVDDEPTVIRLVQRVMGQRVANAQVVTASTGEEALEILAQSTFDLVIVDKNLPGIDGLAVVAWMRSHQQHTPVLLVSAFLTPESREIAANLGVVASFSKPFSVSELCGAVALALGTTVVEPKRDGAEAPPPPPVRAEPGEEGAQTVLVVDDDPSVQKYLLHVLARAGHAVATVSSAEEATEYLRAHAPTLAFVDVNLPRVGGLDLLKIIREFHPDVRVILMTASPEWVTARKREADGFLSKPFPNIPTVLETVRRATEEVPTGVLEQVSTRESPY